MDFIKKIKLILMNILQFASCFSGLSQGEPYSVYSIMYYYGKVCSSKVIEIKLSTKILYDCINHLIFPFPLQADVGKFAEKTASELEKMCRCNECAPYMEQAMLFALIIGRWFLPKSAGITSYVFYRLAIQPISEKDY